jgi:uncharacterized membrane protein
MEAAHSIPLSTIVFDAAWVFLPGALILVALLGLTAWRLMQRGLRWREISALLVLRGAALVIVLVLLGRPVTIRHVAQSSAPYVSLLLDRSLSMSLVENGQSRYTRMYDLVKNRLAPALNRENWAVRPLLFAESARACTPGEIAQAPVDGARTNLAGALAQAATADSEPPLAIIALTDGDANDDRENNKAVTALLERNIPVFPVGFGSDVGPATLDLQKVTAPSIAAVKQEFRVTAQLSASGITGTMPNFDLLLLRDGQLLQTKAVTGFSGSRSWTETFSVAEKEEGRHNYQVQMTPPTLADLVVGRENGSVQVAISNEKDLRILFVQGALTWDYKFVLRALRSDPSIRMTGLSRTSDHSSYRQNVEQAGELIDGFPTTLDQLAPFRVVVISNLKARDLTPAQQEILTRFCGEWGGGVLLIGGAETFDNSWEGTTLEKLLPVTIDTNPGLTDVDQPFHLHLTDEALRNPIFQITDAADNVAAWQSLPTFTHYGRVERAKPGAIVWAEHDEDVGPAGKRILMAAQNYGAGRSAVICVQNFWRWRLAKDADPTQFDRFWRQFFRYLGEEGRQGVLIDFTDQQLEPPTDLHAVLERQSAPANLAAVPGTTPPPPAAFTVLVKGPDQNEILRRSLDLPPGQEVPFSFHAEKEGFYSMAVLDSNNVDVAERSVQLENNKLELENTGRDMENLRQWAALTQGTAFAEEDLRSIDPLIAAIHHQIKMAQEANTSRLHLGLNGWILALLLACLGLEWLLRKRWNLL